MPIWSQKGPENLFELFETLTVMKLLPQKVQEKSWADKKKVQRKCWSHRKKTHVNRSWRKRYNISKRENSKRKFIVVCTFIISCHSIHFIDGYISIIFISRHQMKSVTIQKEKQLEFLIWSQVYLQNVIALLSRPSKQSKKHRII